MDYNYKRLEVAALFLILLATMGLWTSRLASVDSQSIRVNCKYKYPKDTYLYCTEYKSGRGRSETPMCVVSAACSRHAPIYEFTTFVTNKTRECQKIYRCMMDGGAKLCHGSRACSDNMDTSDCDYKPVQFEPGDCLRHRKSLNRHERFEELL